MPPSYLVDWSQCQRWFYSYWSPISHIYSPCIHTYPDLVDSYFPKGPHHECRQRHCQLTWWLCLYSCRFLRQCLASSVQSFYGKWPPLGNDSKDIQTSWRWILLLKHRTILKRTRHAEWKFKRLRSIHLFALRMPYATSWSLFYRGEQVTHDTQWTY